MGKLAFGRDLRKLGSGNAGGTNAFRVFGWKAGVPTVIVDVGKGVLATLVISRLPGPAPLSREALELIAGCAAVVGHVWTVFAGFRGGKGVGTAAGVMVSLYPLPIAICAALFAIVLLATGIVSVASLSAALAFPAALVALSATGVLEVPPILLWFSIPVVVLIFFTHRSNIRRLIAGTENRFARLAVFRRLAARLRSPRGPAGPRAS